MMITLTSLTISSELTFGSFLRREKEKNPRKVNSLIYENYTLVRKEDGIKSYVSPEEKYQILLRQKIKAEDARINWENEKKIRRWKEIDSDSDSGYEIPIEPELKAKPKSCNDLNLVTLAKHPRKSSFPHSDVEFYPEDDEKINLPFYMTSLERSATEPLTNSNKKKRKNKNRNESRTGSNGENDNEQKSDDDLSSSANGKEDKKKSKKSGFSFGNSIGFRGKDRKLKENEKETKEKTVNDFILEKNSKSRKKRFSLPWTKQWPSESQNGEDDVTDESDDSQIKNPKQFAVKLPKLSWRKKKKSKIDALNGEKNSVTGENENEDETQCKTEESSDEEEGKGNDGPLISHEGTKNPSNSCSSSCCEDEESFEESEEVFDKDKAPDNFLFNIRNELDELEAEEQTIKTNLLKNRFAATKSISRTIPSDLLQAKNRRLRNRGAIDPNPLKKMFGIRRPLKIDREETNSKITEKKSVEKPSNGDFSKKAVEFFDGISNGRDAKDSKIPFEFLERKEIGYRDYKFLFNEPETDVQTNQLSFKISKSKILSLTVRSDG